MRTYMFPDFLKSGRLLSLIVAFTLLSNYPMDMTAQSYGNFPYEESFLSPTQPSDITKPESPLTSVPNKATFTDKGLQLTPNEQSSFGGVFINNRSFTSQNGIFIEFEYMVYGGTGGDGLSLFLFDEKTQNPTIGAIGAGIGYAYNRAYLGNDFKNQRMPGLAGAYMGVAFDAFGNFKAMRYQGEARVNGIPYSMPVSNSFDAADNIGNQVTIRGAKGTALTFPGTEDGYTGYPVLITQSTMQNTGFILNYDPDSNSYINDGRYRRFNNFDKPSFTIDGGAEFEDENDPAYRKAIVELFPVAPENEGGFLVTVKIQHANVVDTIIYDYHYKSTQISYPENALTSGASVGDNGSANDLPLYSARIRTLTATVPDNFKIGFAAATGEETNYHIIKNLRMTLPRSAEANDDYAEIPQGTPKTSLFPLDNDLAYSGIIQRVQEGSKDYINKNTFRFRGSDGELTPDPYSYTEAGVGTWAYDTWNGMVVFYPLSSFIGEATVSYDIKGGISDDIKESPYDDEGYRSLPAKITVNVISSPYRQTVTNKMTTIKLK